MELVKVIILGAPAVGKTSIIQQFLFQEYDQRYQPTTQRATYYPSVIFNHQFFHLKISDLPPIPFIPVTSYHEWEAFKFYGLRSATAYILVYDINNLETFSYVKRLRDQILESREGQQKPILIVVANKVDMVAAEPQQPTADEINTTRRRGDLVQLVRKHWKCSHVECSARHNWRVVQVFKELMLQVQGAGGLEPTPPAPRMDNLQDALERNKCRLL